MHEAHEPTEYSRQARARVAFSLACRGLSDFARALVPTSSDGYAHPGEYIENAARIVGEAQQIMQLAVILEREHVTSWEDIGEALGTSKQAAHERFNPAVERWRAELAEPWVPDRGGLLSLQLPDGAEDPAKWAEVLDEWVIRHHEKWDGDRGEHPVSGNLPLASVVEQVSMALAEVRALQEREHAGEATPEQRHGWYQRKAELFQRLAEARPEDPAYAEAAANARRQLQELGTYWTRPLLEGGPFGTGVRLRVRRVSQGQEAEVKSPNGKPEVHREGVLQMSFHPPDGFRTWPEWLDVTKGLITEQEGRQG
jgi:hypothetical protein